LVPIDLDQKFIENVKYKLPEMPNERSIRIHDEYKLSERDADILVSNKNIADFFEKGVKVEKSFGPEDYKDYYNWLLGDISAWLNDNNLKIKETKLKPKQLVDLIKFIREGKITSKIAKMFIDDMMEGISIVKIIKNSGKKRIADEAKIVKIVEEVIKENPKIVEDCKKNPKALQALIGKCMRKTKGQLDPRKTKDIMLKFIKK